MKLKYAIAASLVLFGIGLHAYTGFVEATSFSLPFLLWSISPYVLVGILTAAGPSQMLIGALFLIAAADFSVFHAAFLHPTSSTAPIALICMPMWNVLVVGPVGAALGWLVAWVAKRNAG